MSFAIWCARQYAHSGKVPERYFDMMRSAYNAGMADEREAIIMEVIPGGSSCDPQEICDRIRTRSNVDQP